jgi:hypothetical protein
MTASSDDSHNESHDDDGKQLACEGRDEMRKFFRKLATSCNRWNYVGHVGFSYLLAGLGALAALAGQTFLVDGA